MLVRPTLTLSLLAALALAGCGGGSTKASPAAAPSGAAAGLPSVSGQYGDKPTLGFPGSPPPGDLRKVVLREGTGPAINKGDLLFADYLGEVWNGKVFDNSYDKGQVAAFPIGVGKVIPGWDKTLVGVKAGSRVLLSIPPADGYGTGGNAQAGIAGTDTLTFVIDVVQGVSPTAGADPAAEVQKVATAPVTVGGKIGTRPTVTIAKGATQPVAASTVVLAKGTGKPVGTGTLVLQYEAVDWSGKVVDSTWKDGAAKPLPIGSADQPPAFSSLKGLPLGSRVLLRLPGEQGQSALVVVLDLVAQPGTAKQTG
jgi:peptidylprolyl isomerase